MKKQFLNLRAEQTESRATNAARLSRGSAINPHYDTSRQTDPEEVRRPPARLPDELEYSRRIGISSGTIQAEMRAVDFYEAAVAISRVFA